MLFDDGSINAAASAARLGAATDPDQQMRSRSDLSAVGDGPSVSSQGDSREVVLNDYAINECIFEIGIAVHSI